MNPFQIELTSNDNGAVLKAIGILSNKNEALKLIKIIETNIDFLPDQSPLADSSNEVI